MRDSARWGRCASGTSDSNSVAMKTRLAPWSDDINTILAALGWSWNQSRGVANTKMRIRPTTTSYCHDARGKSQKMSRRRKRAAAERAFRSATYAILTFGLVFTHDGQN